MRGKRAVRPLVDWVLLNDGAGGFEQRHEVGGSADRTYTAALADLNGDADLDLVVGNDRPDDKRVYFNNGNGDGVADVVAGRSDAPNTLYLGCCRAPGSR